MGLFQRKTCRLHGNGVDKLGKRNPRLARDSFFIFYISNSGSCVCNGHFVFFCIHFLLARPRRRFVFQTEISGKYIVLVLISLPFYFFSSLNSPWGSVYRFFVWYLVIAYTMIANKQTEAPDSWCEILHTRTTKNVMLLLT